MFIKTSILPHLLLDKQEIRRLRMSTLLLEASGSLVGSKYHLLKSVAYGKAAMADSLAVNVTVSFFPTMSRNQTNSNLTIVRLLSGLRPYQYLVVPVDFG